MYLLITNVSVLDWNGSVSVIIIKQLSGTIWNRLANAKMKQNHNNKLHLLADLRCHERKKNKEKVLAIRPSTLIT